MLCSDRLSVQRDKVHILFGGTRILQHTGDRGARIRTPDGGCLAVVLRTGFDTSQGAQTGTALGLPHIIGLQFQDGLKSMAVHRTFNSILLLSDALL